MSAKDLQAGKYIDIQKRALDLQADAILLLDIQSAGKSLIMTDNNSVLAGAAIKYIDKENQNGSE